MAGLYIHIPFCKQACYYCDFHFSTNQNERLQLCEAIATEIKLQGPYLGGESLETIYLGGGTPSLLSLPELEIIFSSIYKNHSVLHDAEITLEANPDDLSKEKLSELRQVGINRLSIGVQSFQDDILRFFNRAHRSKESIESILLAQEAGFSNLSIDLIYAVPEQDLNQWRKNIEQALALNLEHISAYSLTIEEKTVFGQWQKRGRLKALGENESVADFELLIDTLIKNGYEHYEISNFSKPGFYSKHNSNYWKQRKYLGVGPSAHSYNGDSRQSNVSNNWLYLKSIKEGRVPFEREVLSRENKINEYIFTSLRTQWGCDFSYLEKEFGYPIDAQLLQQAISHGLLILNGPIAKLTLKGKLLADQIATDFFVSH